MTKSNRRGWLNKISKWILDAFPGESSQQQVSPPSSPARKPEPVPEKASVSSPRPRPEAPAQKTVATKVRERTPAQAQPLAEAPEASGTSMPEAPEEKTLIKAWKAFELAWNAAGLSPNYFLDAEQLISTLSVLDQTFEEELIEWLYQICTKPEALSNLAAIIERGQVRPTDNVDAIRAFAYVSVAVVSRVVLQVPNRSDPSLIEEPLAPSALETKPDKPLNVALVEPIEVIETSSQPEQPSSDGREQEPLITQRFIESTTGAGIPNQAIGELQGLSMRSCNSMRRSDIHTLLDLANKSEEDLLSIKYFGERSVNEVRAVLEKLGLSLPFAASEISTPIYATKTESPFKTGDEISTPSYHVYDIKDLGLSARTLDSLYKGNIFSITELVKCTESQLLSFPTIGQTTLNEVRKALAKQDLSLSVTSSPTKDASRICTAQDDSQTHFEDLWDQLKQRSLDLHGTLVLSEKQLIAICHDAPENHASIQLHELLIRLQSVVGYLNANLMADSVSLSSDLGLAIKALEKVLYGRLLNSTMQTAQLETNRLLRGLSESNPQDWQVYLQRSMGQTLTSIAENMSPPVSRDVARNMETKISRGLGIKPSDLAKAIKEAKAACGDAAELEALQSWISRFERLPISTDEQPADLESATRWERIVRLSLKDRINLLAKHRIVLSLKEYDYHYAYVTARTGPVGTGYWREFENLKQFVIRHAAMLGNPNVMPNQTSFPPAVHSAVTSYGGQSKVARRIGLDYHNQLVGENGGRTYWTDEKLEQLLVDVNAHIGLSVELMPSQAQVLGFFSSSQDPIYQGKKPHSVVAALSKFGKLHWSEVAKRFGKRFIPGESNKAVTISYIKAFVRDLGEHLNSLTPSELFVLFQAQGINRGEREKFSRTFDALVDAVQSGMVDKDQLRSWADDNEVEAINDLLELGAELKEEANLEDREQLLLERRSSQLKSDFSEADVTAEVSVDDLPTLEPKAVLRALDKATELVETSSSDEDKVEFLKAKATAKLWDSCFRDEPSLIAKLRSFESSSNAYSHEVQQAFLEEYDGAKALAIPASYSFRDLKGIPREPKLMQRLVAYRLERDMRLLNLSGTGTGKTLSAIFGAQICGSQRILISCPNGVIDSWQRCFDSAYPSATLHIKPDLSSLEELDDGVHVVIVNHERFQDRFAQQLLGFCIGFQADLIVIDEIHKSKRRTTEASSQRRKLMNEFIRISINLNPDLRVLGLSATPVINNLYEGRSLIELICQEPLEDVGEKVDLTACMNLYQHFVVRGIRMNPGKMPRTQILLHDVDATPLLPQIVRATKKGSFHDIEQLLVAPKINCLSSMLQRGSKTVIFITYIKNTLEPLCNWLASNQFSFSVFTGDDKDAQEEGYRDSLDEFIRGNSEVLVATIQCAGTGIDGLQSVCNRAIFFQLPWTSTEFEQAIGRLDRDGTDFDSVSVHIPITDIALPDGQRWSWCRSKLDRIESKRDIAKAAVDGEIPDAAALITPSEASKYWLKWLEKLDQATHGSGQASVDDDHLRRA